MIPQHISSDELWLLDVLVETRSLAHAARRLEISVATAARRLNELRSKLNDPLFVRGSRGFVPTRRLEAMLPRVRALRTGLEELTRTEAFEPSRIRRTVRIAGVDNAVIAFLLPCFKQLYKEAPGLRISLVALPENYPKALEEGGIDLVLYAPPHPPGAAGIRTAPLFRARHMLVVRRGHPVLDEIDRVRASGGVPDGSLLEPYKEVEVAYGGANARTEGETSVDADADNASIAFESAYFLPAAFIVLETDFFVRLPVRTANYLAQWLPLEQLPETMRALPVWEGKLVWHERTDLDPVLRWMRSVLTRILRDSDPEAS